MELTKADIKSMDEAGECDKGKLFHIVTHGGFNVIVSKSAGGEMKVLGTGAHKGLAKHMASQVNSSCQWNDLFKTEDLSKAPTEIAPGHTLYTPEEHKAKMQAENRDNDGLPIQESSPQNHYDLAAHHSKLAGKVHASVPADLNQKHDRNMQLMFHADTALKHYQASGLNYKQANKEHEKQMQHHNELEPGTPAPFNGHSLERDFNRKNPAKRFPTGLPYDYTK